MFSRPLLLSLWLTVGITAPRAQDAPFDFAEAEQRLVRSLDSLVANPCLARGERFQQQLVSVLHAEGAFDHPFDSLARVGRIQSPNGRVRLFTWNIPRDRGEQVYMGVLMTRDRQGHRVFPLTDARNRIANPQQHVGSPSEWFGALYYHIHEQKVPGGMLYTLLGLSFNNILTTKRVIEALWIEEGEPPVFGAPLFQVRNRRLHRVIFEYSARATMTLRWSPEHRMIVFDHLVPPRSDLTGHHQFYGPDMTFDGFRFEKGHWVFVPNIDVRNPRRNRRPAPETFPEPSFLQGQRPPR